MLTIRHSQMRVFDDAVVDRFVAAVADDLSQSQPESVRGLSRGELIQHCRLAVATGRASGLSDRADLHGFVALSFILGPDFHRHEAIAAILRGPAVADGRKMRVVTGAILATLGKGSHRKQQTGSNHV